MKVILTQDVIGLGKKGQLVDASDGHARNYLLPKKLAIEASAANINTMKTRQEAEATKKEREHSAALALANKLKSSNVTIKTKCGDTGRLFGSITSSDISTEIKKQTGLDIDKKKLVLTEIIKHIGTYEVEAKLYPEVSVKFSVSIVQI